jgi:Arc/MetJ-type ribon-helix-helix transcriptional regulator
MSDQSGKHVKMSITLPPSAAARIAAAVEAGEAPTASAYIAAAIDTDAAREAARQRTRSWIQELNGGPVDQGARDYWLRQFGVIGEEPGQVSA